MTQSRSQSEEISSTFPVAARFLENALLWTFVAHGLAMLGMALFLLPGLPGGGVNSDAARAAYIAAHPWKWRLGWLPWQLTALSDIALSIALLRTRWIPRLPAIVTLLLTCAAIVPDQGGQALWVTRGIELASQAVQTGDLSAYLAFENRVFPAVGAWAAILYTVSALGWTWCFASAGTWNRRLSWFSVATWGVFVIASVGPLLPGHWRLPPPVVAGANAIGFVLLELWFLLVLEQVLRRSRPDALHGRFAVWKHPQTNTMGRASNLLANSRVARRMFETLPSIAFDSDITDVIYINYLVPAERLELLVPSGLELQRLGPNGRYALFTFLTYRHGHLGPRLLKSWRQQLPSPLQTNWRIHVSDPRTGAQGIHFVANGSSNPLQALGARLMMESMPMHPLAVAELTREPNGAFHLRLDPGSGSGPDVEARLHPTDNRALSAPWTDCFADYEAFLAYCVPQNRAISSQPWYNRTSRQEIRLDIPLTDCKPLQGTVDSRMAQAIVGDALPVCFHVPKVAFRFDRQEFDYEEGSSSRGFLPD